MREGGEEKKAENISSLLMSSKVKSGGKNIFITVDVILYCDINIQYILIQYILKIKKMIKDRICTWEHLFGICT